MQAIERWTLNSHKLLTIKAELDSFDDDGLFKKSTERLGFEKTETTVTIPTYFYRVNGVIGEEDEFYDRIFALNEKLQRINKLYLRIDKGLDKKIDNDTINKIQLEWQQLEKRGPVNPQNIIKAVELSNSINKFTDKKHRNLVLNSLRRYLETYFELNKRNVNIQAIKNILIHLIYWINLYVEQLLIDFDYSGVTPKVLCYGSINKREAHFLCFLNCLGADVIYINTASTAPFDQVDPASKLSTCADALRQLPLRSFPKERINTAMQTQAFSASEELRETLHSDDSMFYRPWQLIDYSVRSLTLISTYDEIGILAKEQAIMRNGWEVGYGHVTIPSFFAKVIGVRKDINQYYAEINALRKLPKTHFFDKLPISNQVTKLLKIEYYSVCGDDNLVDTERLINAGFWPYRHLQKHVQYLIANSVRDFCSFKGIKRQRKYGIDEQRLIIFTTMMSLDNESLQLLQVFDYPKEVPKCIIYNNEINGELIFEDSILIYFFSSVGMDVIVYNPSGRNDIEIYIEDSMFKRHHLEEVAFNLPFKSFAVFGKYIK
ncbi:hypothetical protein DMA11_19895 [Marinilabiliaceae bacterium JC017]|nr:hypothetical protein DMA11_19895 [Marinilabiliaceae bacterium JC017]